MAGEAPVYVWKAQGIRNAYYKKQPFVMALM